MAGGCTEEVVELKFEMTFASHLYDRLHDAARHRDRTPVSLLAEIIETVLVDDLVGAVLDDASSQKKD